MELWKIKYEHIHDSLTDEEFNFLMDISAEQDDGNYYITEEIINDALKDMGKEKISKLQKLIITLREQLKKEETTGISFNFG